MKKHKQMWICVKCEKSGAVHFKEHAGIYEVVELLRQSHREVSPNCDGSKLRVIVDTAAQQERALDAAPIGVAEI